MGEAQTRQRASLRKFIEEPYRLFFPLGALWSFIGIAFWIPKAFHPGFEEISTKVHVWVQVYGFIWTFVAGFMLTALPFFTGTRAARMHEVLLLLAGCFTAAGLALSEAYRWAHLAFLVNLALLLAFIAPRILGRTRPPPPTFVFFPFALFSAVFGSGALFALLSGVYWRPAELSAAAHNLLFQGFPLLLILGVGGFLIRTILGWGGGSGATPAGARDLPLWLHLVCGTGIVASFFVEAFAHERSGVALRAALATVEAVGQMRIHRRPGGRHQAAAWLRLGLWLIVAGLWGLAFAPVLYRLSVLHICFIGGFGLIVFGVATHAILSHGGYGTEKRGRGWPFLVAALLMLLGLMTRFTADFLPASATRHLAYAALAWCLGLLVWGAAFLVRVMMAPSEADA